MKEVIFDVDGVKYKVRKPSGDEYREARKAYNRAFNDALKSDAPLRAAVTDILKEQNLWNDDKQKEMESLQKDIADQEVVLHKGGIKKSEAKVVALKIKKLREKFRDLIAPITDFNRHTAEGQADNANFDYLASVCIVKEDGSPYFHSYEDYLTRENDNVTTVGSRKFANVYYGLSEDYESTLIENQVLKELGFANDKLQLIDSKGRLIDEDGRLVDKEGRYVDEEGNYVNIYGHKLTETGELKGERGVFIDDEADIAKDSAPS